MSISGIIQIYETSVIGLNVVINLTQLTISFHDIILLYLKKPSLQLLNLLSIISKVITFNVMFLISAKIVVIQNDLSMLMYVNLSTLVQPLPMF